MNDFHSTAFFVKHPFRIEDLKVPHRYETKGESVPVLLWRIMPNDEKALDRYEGYPHLYRKETVKVRFKGQWVPAMVYIMNEGRPLGAPGRYYYEVIRQGYIDAGFDISFLNKAVRDSISAAEKSEV